MSTSTFYLSIFIYTCFHYRKHRTALLIHKPMNSSCTFTCRANVWEGRASRWGQGRGERQVSENDGDRCGGDKKANNPLSHPRTQSQHSVHQNYAEEPGQTLEVAVYLSAVLWVEYRHASRRPQATHRRTLHKPAIQKNTKYRNNINTENTEI